MRAHGHDHGANRHMCSGRAAETGRVGQGQGAGGAHTHKGCQSPIELVVGVSMEIGVGYCSVKWRFSAGERGRPSLLQGPWEGSYGKSKNWEVCDCVRLAKHTRVASDDRSQHRRYTETPAKRKPRRERKGKLIAQLLFH